MAPSKMDGDAPHIIDIRQADIQFDLLDDIRTKLQPPPGAEKELPTLLLYDETGLKLFEDITYLDEYYLTNAEIDALKRHAHSIVDRIPQHSQIIELGSGYSPFASYFQHAVLLAGREKPTE